MLSKLKHLVLSEFSNYTYYKKDNIIVIYNKNFKYTLYIINTGINAFNLMFNKNLDDLFRLEYEVNEKNEVIIDKKILPTFNTNRTYLSFFNNLPETKPDKEQPDDNNDNDDGITDITVEILAYEEVKKSGEIFKNILVNIIYPRNKGITYLDTTIYKIENDIKTAIYNTQITVDNINNLLYYNIQLPANTIILPGETYKIEIFPDNNTRNVVNSNIYTI